MVKVSVIVPVYKVERYIEKCLDSLVNQTLQDIEIIVVNDGSPDNSEDIILKFQEQYANIVYIKKENAGVAVARNVGLQSATGEYITFVDSDDYIDLDMLECLYTKAKSTGAEVVVSGYYDEADNGKYKIRGLGSVENYGGSLFEKPAMVYANTGFACTKLFSRQLIVEHKLEFKKYRIFEDMLFFYSALLFANKVEKVDRAFYHYIRRENVSATGKMSDKFYDLFPVMQDMRDLYQSNGKEFQEYLTFITLKHAYLRFRMNVDKETSGLKKQYIMDSYAFFDVYDPSWRNNPYFKITKRKIWFCRTVGYWMIRPKLINVIKKILG